MILKEIRKKISQDGVVKTTEEVINNIENNDVYNSFISTNKEKVLKRAKKLENMDSSNMKLFGIPVSIKDNIAVKDYNMTCGSNLLKNHSAGYNATVIQRLKKEGAIIIGKTNMDEFAMGTSNEYSAFGSVKNPLNEEYIPGGSSGGSAASVSAGFVPLSLGSDTGGSVRQPAAFNGLIGFKPTYGRISRYGLTAFASSLDQIGPLANNIDDLIDIYSIIAGKDNKDSTSSKKIVESLEKLKTLKKEKFKIGVPYNLIKEGVDSKIKEDFLKVIEILKENGQEIIEINFDKIDYVVPTYYILAPAEASSNLARFDGIRYGNRAKSKTTKEDLVSYTRDKGFLEEVKRRCLLGTYVLSSGYADKYYKKALIAKKMISEEVKNKFERVDVIAIPTTPNMPHKIGEKKEDIIYQYKSDIFTIQANLSGVPAISTPMYKHKDFYTSIQFMANSFKEKNLFDIVKVMQKIIGGKK